jgi:Na+/H+ antiporter NhaD/arsenite permease-like protein
MRATTAIALLIALLTVVGRDHPWISILLALFAVCLLSGVISHMAAMLIFTWLVQAAAEPHRARSAAAFLVINDPCIHGNVGIP